MKRKRENIPCTTGCNRYTCMVAHATNRPYKERRVGTTNHEEKKREKRKGAVRTNHDDAQKCDGSKRNGK